jgi:hypothetical protein
MSLKNAMNLKVHLVQSLLHMQDMLGRHLNQAAAVSPEIPVAESWRGAVQRSGGTGATDNRIRLSSGPERSLRAVR